MNIDADQNREAAADGLRHVLDEAYERLENPFVLIDTSYNLIDHTENVISDDPLWNELIEKGRFSHETVDFFNAAKFIQVFADSESVALMSDARLPYDRACAKIFDNSGVQIGSIVVVACYRAFQDGDFEQMESVCQRISEALQKHKEDLAAESVYYDAFISDLLEGRAAEGLDEVRAELKPYLFLLAANVTRYESTLSHLAYFKDLFSRLQPEFKYYLYLDNIVILASAEHPEISVDKELRKLNDFFLRYNIFAGMSKAFEALPDARKYYQQAIDALNRGMASEKKDRIFEYTK